MPFRKLDIDAIFEENNPDKIYFLVRKLRSSAAMYQEDLQKIAKYPHMAKDLAEISLKAVSDFFENTYF